MVDPCSDVTNREKSAGRAGFGREWRHGCAALAVVILWLLVSYWTTAVAMEQIWLRSETFAHGFLVPVMSAWLIWRDRERLVAITPCASPWLLLGLPLAGVAWIMGELGNVNSLSQLSLVSLIVLSVPLVLGMRVARALVFPLLFLFFMVPLGEFLLPVLMSSTADFTVSALRLTGIPVYREGQHLVIPSGQWSVIEACSGIRYLIASLMVGTLYAYLSYRSLLRRILFVGVSLLVPLVANWLRAYFIVLLGHVSNNKLATGVDHIVYGWVFFGMVMALMFWLGSLWHEDPLASGEVRPLAAPEGVPFRPGLLWLTVLLSLFVSAAPLGLLNFIHTKALEAGTPKLAELAEIPGWTPSPNWDVSWRPRYQWAADETFRTYRKDGREVGVYIGYYRNQDTLKKLVSSENVLVSTQDNAWLQTSRGQVTVPYMDGSLGVKTGELFNMAADQRLLAWSWYWIGGRRTSDDFWGKAYTAWSRLLARGDDSAGVVVYAKTGAPGQAQATLAEFLHDAGPALEQTLSRTWQGQ